jgi:hypothetical protein
MAWFKRSERRSAELRRLHQEVEAALARRSRVLREYEEHVARLRQTAFEIWALAGETPPERTDAQSACQA